MQSRVALPTFTLCVSLRLLAPANGARPRASFDRRCLAGCRLTRPPFVSHAHEQNNTLTVNAVEACTSRLPGPFAKPPASLPRGCPPQRARD